jgi:hypothetical protein
MKKKYKPYSKKPIRGSILDSIGQLRFAAEHRIRMPKLFLDDSEISSLVPVAVVPTQDLSPIAAKSHAIDQMVAEVATSLWYLKTKYFKRDWENQDSSDDDPRTRRALGRLNKGINALKHSGVEIHDPTNKRYPQGGENMMRPIQFQPTVGLTFEKVTETVVPIVYLNERLIQRGEVFVAVPQDIPSHSTHPAPESGEAQERASEA